MAGQHACNSLSDKGGGSSAHLNGSHAQIGIFEALSNK